MILLFRRRYPVFFEGAIVKPVHLRPMQRSRDDTTTKRAKRKQISVYEAQQSVFRHPSSLTFPHTTGIPKLAETAAGASKGSAACHRRVSWWVEAPHRLPLGEKAEEQA